jgi:hypothetical protein
VAVSTNAKLHAIAEVEELNVAKRAIGNPFALRAVPPVKAPALSPLFNRPTLPLKVISFPAFGVMLCKKAEYFLAGHAVE